MRLFAAGAFALFVFAASALAQGEPFAGGWRAQGVIMGQQASVELILQANGSFSQQTVTPGALVTIRGTYRVFPEQRVLRLDIRDYEPKEWCGPLGCNRILMPDGETHNYAFPSPNQLILRDVSGQYPEIHYQRAF